MTDKDLARFLAELTNLSIKFGIAINGNPELYVMTDEDRARIYSADNESRLRFE